MLTANSITNNFWSKSLINSIQSIILADLKSRLSSEINQYIYVGYTPEFHEDHYMFEDIISSLLVNIKNHTYSVYFHQVIHFKRFSHNELVLVDTLKTLRSLYGILMKHRTRNVSHTIIYMSTVHDPNHSDIQEALELLWQLSILNVGIIIKLPNQDIVLVTYYPFRYLSCQTVKPVIINRFDMQRQVWRESKEFFPPKLKNFYGCSLTCATWEEMPYMTAERNKKGKIIDFSGLEGDLLDYMAERLNFSITLYLMTETEIEQSNKGNNTFFRQLFANIADYALGGFFYKPDPNGTAPFSQTNFYYMSSIHLVTNIVSDYTPYDKLAFPFDAHVWFIIGIVYAMGSAVIFALSYAKANRRAFVIGHANPVPYYNMFVTFVGAYSAVPLPRRNFARFLFTVWLLATLVLRSAYQSGMYQMLRNNKHRDPPQTIKDVIGQNYIIEMVPTNVGFLESLPEVKRVRVLNTTELEEFENLSLSKQRTAIITAYEYYGYFRKLNPYRYRLHLVNELIFTQQLSFYVRRNSYLVDVLSDQIIQAQSYGFANLWGRGLIEREQRDLEENVESRGLSLLELEAIFMIMIWSHIGAIVVFIMEILVGRRNKLQEILK